MTCALPFRKQNQQYNALIDEKQEHSPQRKLNGVKTLNFLHF